MAYLQRIRDRALELCKEKSPEKATDQLHDEFPKEAELLSPRTVRRWLRAEKVEQAKKETKQLTQNSLEEHRAHLLEIIDILLDGDVKHVIVVDKGESTEDSFGVASPESGYYELRLSELGGRIETNIDDVCEQFSSWDMFDCFVPHLMAEYPPEQDYYELLYKYPGKLINTLRTLAQRKTFKGTCPICKDWH